jgi:hypothetical protein
MFPNVAVALAGALPGSFCLFVYLISATLPLIFGGSLQLFKFIAARIV